MFGQPKVVKGGTLIDGTGKPTVGDCVVVIAGSKIVEVGPAGEVEIPEEAEVIDAKGKTVIPGFIDSHTHFILMGVRTLTTLDLSKTKSIARARAGRDMAQRTRVGRERLAGEEISD